MNTTPYIRNVGKKACPLMQPLASYWRLHQQITLAEAIKEKLADIQNSIYILYGIN